MVVLKDKIIDENGKVVGLARKNSSEIYFSNFLERYSNWLGNMKTEEEVNVLKKLIEEMKFYSKIDIKSLIKTKIYKLKSDHQNFENTNIIPMVSNNRRFNGSYDVIALLKEIDREEAIIGREVLPYKDTIVMDPREIDENSDTVLIIDDICGTGGTLEEFFEDNILLFNNKNVIVLFLVINKHAQTKLEEIKRKYKDINLSIDCCEVVDKLCNYKYLSEQEFEILEKIERSLWRRKHRNIMGYENSQLLIGFSHNIPNNTISSIWYESKLGKRKEWSPLFSRYTKRSKKDRSKKNYGVKKSGN